ncbi:MAG: hypothetical protein II956_07525 [Bacteroidales bacterium]|nr:hypothetical protein [Bacteroidales bacterium]
MSKLIITVFFICLGLNVLAQDSTAMRKSRFSFLSEAELSPSQSFKGRGLSFSGLVNFSDHVSLGLGVKPYMMFYRQYDYCYEYFTINPDGKIIRHTDRYTKSEFDNDFCLPVYLVVKCMFAKRTNASPFVEVRIGKDVINATQDLYRAVSFGARFGFKNNYSRAVNVSFGWQRNGISEDFHDYNGGTILFKVGYEF